MASRCKYCCLGGNEDRRTDNELQDTRVSLRREMGQMKTDDVAMQELIEELQQRVQELMYIVDDQHDRIVELQAAVKEDTYDRGSLARGPITPLTKKYTDRLTPYDWYRRYLVGDYEADPPPENKGFQLDEDIENRVDVLPKEMLTPKNFLPKPDEDDRIEDRKKIRDMFLALGTDSGEAVFDFTELEDYIKNPATRDAAIAEMRRLYVKGTTDNDASGGDIEEKRELEGG